MAQYELTLIFAEQTEQDAIDKTIDGLQKIIEKTKGTVEVVPWGKRELAYPIRNNHYGHYVQLNLNIGTEVPLQLEKKVRLDDSVLRHLTVRVN